MQAILNQLGDQLLGSIPTVIFFLLLLLAYGALVRRPLEKVLADRHGRTGGAMDEARAAIAAAEAKTAEYETRLRDARADLFAKRAAQTKAAVAARESVLNKAREEAQRRVLSAREATEQAAADARAQLEAGAASLSQSVLAAILPHRAGAAQ